MSVSYSTLPVQSQESSEEESDALINGRTPAAVRIESYIPARKRTILFDVGILFAVLVVFAITLGLVVYHKKLLSSTAKPDKETTKPSHSGWINSYRHIGSESVMRLIDVNGDGADDAIFGVAQLSKHVTVTAQPQYCKQYKKGCLGSVMALDGRTGQEIWNISTYNEVFELNCGNIDINKDGKMDCLGAGRTGTYIAFDPYNGELLWKPQTGNEDHIDYSWNIYNPLVVNDIQGDNIEEVILSHGGDPKFDSDEKKRKPGRLILLNGADGAMVDRYIDMPDGHETYNSPVLHTDKQGEQYILIGTGGETILGNLLITRLKDLIVKMQSEEGKQMMVKKIRKLQRLKKDSIFFKIFSSGSKGVMIPVVLADVTNDRCTDIIVNSFDGAISAFDGDTFNRIWVYQGSGTESYTTPGVGYFNDDKTLDFMMHWNYGSWPDYNHSEVVVHNGKDGTALWRFNTTRFSMTSDLVIRTTTPYQDMFVFRVQGRSGIPFDDGVGVIHGIDPQRDILGTTAATKSRMKRSSLSCDLNSENMDNLASEVFVVDWKTRNAPKRVFRRDVDKYFYDAVKEAPDDSRFDAPLAPAEPLAPAGHRKQCVIMEQSSRTTGAIGDVNRDNKLDLVLTFNADGIVKGLNNDFLRTEISLDIVVIELEANFMLYPIFIDNEKIVQPQKSNMIPPNFKPQNDQIWTEYMGHNSLSIYNM